MSTTFDTDLVFTESVSQLIQRLLNPIGIKDHSIFNLYGISTNFCKIQPDDKCYTLFASEYEKFVIIQSNFNEIDVYFENMHGFIRYDKSFPVSNLAGIAMNCFSIHRDSSFYVFFDPTTNSIISMKRASISPILIIKSFQAIIPGMIFNLNTLSQFNTQSLTIEDMSLFLFTNPLHHIFRSLREHRDLPFELSRLDTNQINNCLESFKDESHIADLTHQEQTSFLFMLLSSGEPLISPNLQLLAIDAMKVQNDVARLEMAKVFIMYMPFSTHMILIELVQIYGGGYKSNSNHEEAISILTETFFRRIIDREMERKFISFLFLFYQSLIPLKKDSKEKAKVAIFNQKLVLFDSSSDQQFNAFTIDGPCDIKLEQTTPLVINNSINDIKKEILDKYVMERKGISNPNQGGNDNSAQRCISLYKSINQKLKDNFPKEILYPFCEYLDDLNLEEHKIIS